jgi:predicted MPP superfamily phosphohydrolase
VIKNRGRYYKGAAFGNLGFCTSWAVDAHNRGAEWIEVVKITLELENLPEAFHGKRIVHISDLHCSRTVSGKYLGHCIKRINLLDADIVVLTGDYVTYDVRGRFSEKVAELVRGIQSRLGLYACLGNHDYGVGGVFRSQRKDTLYQMIEGMEAVGVNVLRNESSVLEIDGQGLWLVGLGDLWAEDFKPEKAFAGVGANDAVIALAHNPEAVEHMEKFAFDAVMCGHTHGAQVEWTASFGRPVINRRCYSAGMYHIGDKKLYVNRGLGRLGKALFNTRPEITVFSLC